MNNQQPLSIAQKCLLPIALIGILPLMPVIALMWACRHLHVESKPKRIRPRYRRRARPSSIFDKVLSDSTMDSVVSGLSSV